MNIEISYETYELLKKLLTILEESAKEHYDLEHDEAIIDPWKPSSRSDLDDEIICEKLTVGILHSASNLKQKLKIV